MSKTPTRTSRGGRPQGRGQGGSVAQAERLAAEGREALTGSSEAPPTEKSSEMAALVSAVAARVTGEQRTRGVSEPLETMSRMRASSILHQAVPNADATTVDVKDNTRSLLDVAENVETSLINDIFFSEQTRLKDYETYGQIYSMITQAAEAVQVFTDNIISPDDWTKRDVELTYLGTTEAGEDAGPEINRKYAELNDSYEIDEILEESITEACKKGDHFTLVYNLRQEVELLLQEGADLSSAAEEREQAVLESSAISSHHVPTLIDSDMVSLFEAFATEEEKRDGAGNDQIRSDLASYFSELITVNESVEPLAARKAVIAASFGADVRRGRSALPLSPGSRKNRKTPSLSQTGIRGSIVKQISPENVIKLVYDDTLFGYYYVEFASDPEFGRRAAANTSDGSGLLRSVDSQIASRIMAGGGVDTAKDRLISRVFVKTLAGKLGKQKFLADNEQFARDAYAILRRAKHERKRAIITYVAPDQMVHWTPNSTRGYGESVLARVKFLAKLYIGTMANAFMRNTLRQTEMLAYYIDVGLDNDSQNSVNQFMRAVKQREVRFNGLRDISTVLNQVGNFHDLFIPTINGERPVEIETVNLGRGGEVNSDYLEFLRKAIISGMGVPAAFVGYSEEIAFARSLTMDNGRFLRRCLRHQKSFGAGATQLVRLLWANEFSSLEDIQGPKAKEDGKDEETAKEPAEKGRGAKEASTIDFRKIVARFPSPATLNMTNLTDRIGQVQQLVEFVSSSMVDSDDDKVKKRFTFELVKDMIPNLPWEKYASFLEKAKKNATRSELATPPEGDQGAAGASGPASPGL